MELRRALSVVAITATITGCSLSVGCSSSDSDKDTVSADPPTETSPPTPPTEEIVERGIDTTNALSIFTNTDYPTDPETNLAYELVAQINKQETEFRYMLETQDSDWMIENEIIVGNFVIDIRSSQLALMTLINPYVDNVYMVTSGDRKILAAYEQKCFGAYRMYVDAIIKNDDRGAVFAAIKLMEFVTGANFNTTGDWI